LISVYGVELPVLIDSLNVEQTLVGTRQRNALGWNIEDRRRIKSALSFSLAPKPLDEAMLYKLLIEGAGEYWSMVTNAYGAKGYGITGSGAHTLGTGHNPYVSNGVWQTEVGETMAVPWRQYSQTDVAGAGGSGIAGHAGATLVGWRWSTTYSVFGWSWRINEGTPSVKREMAGALGSSGSPQAYTGSETFSNSGGVLTMTAAGATSEWCAMLVLPWYFGATQVDQLMTGHSLLREGSPALPRVHVMTDLLPTSQRISPTTGYNLPLICLGTVEKLGVQPRREGGVWTKTIVGMSATLEEV